MSLIEDIRKDREVPRDGVLFTQMNRIPQMEAALLAAEELADAMKSALDAELTIYQGSDFEGEFSSELAALDAYRAATGAA